MKKKSTKSELFMIDVAIVEEENTSVPEWHKAIVRKRLADAKAHPENLLTWDHMMRELVFK